MKPSRLCGQRSAAAAFTLVELLLAVALGGALAAAALQLLLLEGQGLQRLGRVLRERSHLRRTLELVRGDVLRAEAISAHPERESHACPLAGRRPVLHLRMAAGAAVTYSVGAAPSGIWRGQVLMRCGPAFGLDGVPNTAGSALNRVVVDGLAPPREAWSGCAALLGEPGAATISWLNGSAREGVAICRTGDGARVGIRLTQRVVAGQGRSLELGLESAAGLG
jgi:type II secretory pathway pseudopilin PulG